MNQLVPQIEAISSDRVRGASELALRALEILGQAALEDQSEKIEQLSENIKNCIRLLLTAKPAMAAISNCVRCFERHFDRVLADQPSIEKARCRIAKAARKVADAAIHARSSSILHAVELVIRKKIIATCSFSSTVIEALKKAKEQGGVFRVVCMESATGGLKYGELTAALLADCGVSTIVAPDSQMKEALRAVETVIIGSDSVFSDGSVVNGYPSLMLAQAATGAPTPIPLYCVTDWTKVCTSALPSPLEQGFDLIPSQLVSGIITEKGLLAPSDVPRIIESLASLPLQ